MARRVAVVVLAVVVDAVLSYAQVPDHLKCYKVKDPQTKATYTADLDGLTPEPGCVIKVPAKLACVPTTKTNVTPTPPGGGGSGTPNSFFCYKTKCPKATLPPLAGADQFGSRTVAPSGAKLVCAPLAGPSTTSTATTTTSTSSTTTVTCPPPQLPATGQTTCWDSSGTVIACAGTGQDGDLRKGGALTYMDNGDGTITDVNTSLVWEKQSNGDGSIHDIANTYTWDQAFSGHVATLNTMSFAGHTDWRVPNRKELESIVNLENFLPSVSPAFNNNCTSPCTVLTCSCTASALTAHDLPYWSSSSNAWAPEEAWRVIFNSDGAVGSLPKSSSFSQEVRAVRGGS